MTMKWWAGFCIALFCWTGVATAGVEIVDAKKIYIGDANAFSNAAVVSSKKVFAEIPEYQTILAEGLDKNDARYWVLLKRANETFRRALKKVADEQGYDLVGEKGAIVGGDDEVGTITRLVIEALES
ncbi:MAG: hypothetical protein RL885_21075 [Planctomycetota bacterium]